MGQISIFSDSSCDLPEELLTKHDIKLIPFYVTFDQENYFKENIDINNEDFYKQMSIKGIFPKTSLPSITDYINEFEPCLKEGKDVICLCLNQRFSGSYQSAVNAKQILDEEYEDAKIHIIDSTQATAGQGLILLQIAYMKEAGLSVEDIVQKADILKETTKIMFTVDDLEHLAKGGRIGKVASLAGNLLQLKPLIQMRDKELIPYSNIRGRKKSLDKILDMAKEYFEDNDLKFEDFDFCMANATTLDETLGVQEKVEKLIGRSIPYPVFQIGVTIGTNTGPGAIGICFIRKFETL